jgi:hypothetical protein
MSADLRVYLVDRLWEVRCNLQESGFYCHMMEPGKDYYHRISTGEIYVTHDSENYCLNCGVKKGILSTERPTLADPTYTFLDAKVAEHSADDVFVVRTEPFTES